MGRWLAQHACSPSTPPRISFCTLGIVRRTISTRTARSSVPHARTTLRIPPHSWCISKERFCTLARICCRLQMKRGCNHKASTTASTARKCSVGQPTLSGILRRTQVRLISAVDAAVTPKCFEPIILLQAKDRSPARNADGASRSSPLWTAIGKRILRQLSTSTAPSAKSAFCRSRHSGCICASTRMRRHLHALLQAAERHSGDWSTETPV